jgi:cell division protease FtsH
LKGFKTLFVWIAIILVSIGLVNLYSARQSRPEKIAYSDFISLVQRDEVQARITINTRDNLISGQFVDGSGFVVEYSAGEDPDLLPLLRQHNVPFEFKPDRPSLWMGLMNVLLPLLLLIGVLWFVFVRQVQGAGRQAMSFGRSRAKLHSETRIKVTFDDVAGCDEAKEELREVIEFLKNPGKFQRLGGKIPKGVLLYGATGTGKTLLARAVAGEAGVPFFSISGSDFVEMFVGVGASRVRDLFIQGNKSAPCIIFIDEIDAVGRQRFAGLGGGHDEREQTLNQLLVEMDGFDPNEGVILIAATNRPDVLDPALLRPGRFDRHIVVDKPDVVGRELIIKVHTKNISLAKDVDIKVLARRTPGFSGADLANLVNEAALLAARRNKKKATMLEMEEAVDRVMAGPERKSRVISDYEKGVVTYHESGHALLAFLIPETDPLHKVSIIPRGTAALGYTLQLPIEDRYLVTKKELLGRLTVLLGGRASEDLIYSELTTGAQDDLERATEIAHRMVCELGMSEKLGPMTLGRKERQVFLGRDFTKDKNYSDTTAVEIDKEVRSIIDQCYERARTLLQENTDKLKRLAEALIEREVMDGAEVEEILKGESSTQIRGDI